MGSLTNFLRRLTYAWERHGWRLFGPLLWHNLVVGIEHLRGRRSSEEISDLDVTLGIDTHRLESTALMQIDGEHRLRGGPYQPSAVGLVRRALAILDTDFAAYAFVDYGSGKGRTLLIATEYPFRRIIGVEYARELHEAALANLERVQGKLADTTRIECVWADATRFSPPVDPLVCYLYNPFDDTVLARLLDRLAESYRATPRDILIVYVNPCHRVVLERRSDVTLLKDERVIVTYRLGAPS